jgi:3-hydroxyacyl-CoA dehydrogenase
MRIIRRVAVLGAGTMGSRIAAHFANARIPALLLDVVVPDSADRSVAARRGVENAAKQKPPAFFSEAAMRLVTPGNFEDDLGAIRDCDWVIEAVTENLEIKRALLEKVTQALRPETIVSTNTSGIPLARIAEGFPPEFRRSFLGTHFFNPPRYLHLLEMIPGLETDPELIGFVSAFCDRRLGKGVVRCKDTPNFIGNRIGAFFIATAQKLMMEGGYSTEEVDALTGPLIGLPRSATFRLLDIIGLDTWRSVTLNVFNQAPSDPWRERFAPPEYFNRMIECGWLGEKSGQGFYWRKGAGKELFVLDWRTLEYRLVQKVSLPAAGVEDLPERLRTLVAGSDRNGTFLWSLLSDLFLYAAERVPEISDRIVEVDRAMRWGYAHTYGPFELWDALGFEATALRKRMLARGACGFYRSADTRGQPKTEYFDLTNARFVPLEPQPGTLVLSEIKRARGVVKKNAGASLIDLGEGALCIEFHGERHTLGQDQIEMLCAGIEEDGFEALVIASQGAQFSAGMNLAPVLLAARQGKWEEIDAAVRRLQQANMAIKYSLRPVVVAAFGTTLGAGCEVALHAARVQASAELYMGLAEVGAGLIPAGGGCKELLLRLGDPKCAMELISRAKVSGSAEDARRLGLLREGDAVSMNPERLIADAKAIALALAPSYAPGVPVTDIAVAGEAGCAALEVIAHQREQMSDHDLHVVKKLAYVLSGGRLGSHGTVSEQDLLDLEREAFLSLCGEAKTQERIDHMLKTGQRLKN